jgi:hypothetical protein
VAGKKPKKKGSRALSRRQVKGLTVEQVLEHPVVQQMAVQLRTLKQAVDSLPEAVGRAVAEASQKQVYRGPAYPVTDLLKDPKALGGVGLDLQSQMGDAREKEGLPREVPDSKKKDEDKGGSS